MNDFFGKPLAIGDHVAFIEAHYRNHKEGRVVGFSPQKVRIQFFTGSRRPAETTLRLPSEIIKG